MRPLPCLLVALLLVGCAGASDPPPATAEVAPAPASPGEPAASPPERSDPPPADPSPPTAAPVAEGFPKPATKACASAQRRYFSLRAEANHCTRDDECAEIYPGPCPYGPYYAHVETEPAALDEAAAELADHCGRSKCEMPMPLGIAHCEAGRCEPGRSAPTSGPKSSCWDTEITYVDLGRPYLGSSYEHLQGITPLYAVSVPAKGTLRISAQLGCTDCKLLVSEHNTGMARLVEGVPFTPKPKEPDEIRPVPSRSPPVLAKPLHLEVPVTPGPYYLAAIGGAGELQLEVSLLDVDGHAMAPDRHGQIHLRLCED